MADRKVRVRFAPSPTGPLHIGGVRTALFNYLFAKKHGGDFILRIEDTDQTRFVEGAEAYINASLDWLGIAVDEGVAQGGSYGPYKQSERKDIYLQYAERLINEGWAYYAFDTPEELSAKREAAEAEKTKFSYDMNTRMGLRNSLSLSAEEVEKLKADGVAYVVRFKMPENEEVKAVDMIRGEVTFNTAILDDKVIFKSDGLPTYHLANVVDDYLMKISHVIRGEEWLPSMPLHIMLYRALGWEDERPEFAHLPLILKPTGKGKLSKRDGDKAGFPVFPLEWKLSDDELASGYRECGYFPEAVVNLLALLGWNPGTEQEIFSMEQLIEAFSIERVNKSGARFDPEKAKWFNHQYLIHRSDADLAERFLPILKEKGVEADMALVQQVVGLVKERVSFVAELWEQLSFFFVAPTEYDPKVVKKRWKGDVPAFMAELSADLEAVAQWKAEDIKTAISAKIEEKGLGFGLVMNAFRLALVGGGFGPDLMTIAELIGKEETLARVRNAVAFLSDKA
ncbi:glutamate--tRNA ligase [Saccharicrinis fermentans]|uniref:Glutamate--tRNA ligase n=1 Tax=Saccharicrinis fermentans DSM 9555 = JCM 21142 TaxID=869213 RepID=W7YHK8_9BACT|nr:glutamate--tRNA ligase [Saccharicrinis fermentans]GAF02054.1 glutamate-tRNA ligase [Saccharicrinis fermentans DSM 9555 = JCM 21142]